MRENSLDLPIYAALQGKDLPHMDRDTMVRP